VALLSEEFLLDLLEDPHHPALGAQRAILKVLDLRLELLCTVLGLAQLQRQLMRKVESAIAVFLGGTGGLIEQPDDSLS